MFVLLLVLQCFVLQNIKCQEYEAIKAQAIISYLFNDDFCDRITCEKITDCTDGFIIRKVSNRGCCDQCVKFLKNGELCGPMRTSLGEFLTKQCAAGLKCIEGICETDDSPTNCLNDRTRREQLTTDPYLKYAKDLWLPACDENGHFNAKQYKKKKNICVNDKGQKIFGEAESGLPKNMTCGCSRYLHSKEKEVTFNTKPQEHCTTSGDFDSLQCIDNICYCADREKGDVYGHTTKMSFLYRLPCFDSKNAVDDYLKQCEAQLQRTRSLRYQFSQKHIDIIGLDYVSCDYDGWFASKQCDPSRCVCTNKRGIGIGSYFIERDIVMEMQMTCTCARDEDSSSQHSQYPRMNCKASGNFQTLQCFTKEHCYCVDGDGDVISERIENLTESDCKTMLNILCKSPCLNYIQR